VATSENDVPIGPEGGRTSTEAWGMVVVVVAGAVGGVVVVDWDFDLLPPTIPQAVRLTAQVAMTSFRRNRASLPPKVNPLTSPFVASRE